MNRNGIARMLLTGLLVLACAAVWCGSAAAQNNGRISGQIFDLQGKPYPNVTVTMTDVSTGQSFTAKTDNDGKFVQLGMKGDIYSIHLGDTTVTPPLDYTEKFQVSADQDNALVINLKDVMASYAAAHPEEKEKNADATQFQGMKQHFQAGLDALQLYNTDHAQYLKAAAADKQALKDKSIADAQTAATEFGEAEKMVTAKDTKNHAVILQNEGAALDFEEKYSDAADTFQKAIDLKPDAGLYVSLATDIAQSTAAQPSATDAQLEEGFQKAAAACGQAVTLDPTKGGVCWRNVGIPFYNKARMKQASEAMQKATAADPTNPDAWYFLGSALLNLMESKQEKDKITYIIQPGTQEAYQKYLDLAPTGPHAQECKDALTTIASLQGGESTVLKNKKKN